MNSLQGWHVFEGMGWHRRDTLVAKIQCHIIHIPLRAVARANERRTIRVATEFTRRWAGSNDFCPGRGGCGQH